MSSFNLSSIPVQKGKIAIVTGANIGLGYETALALAKKEFKVILACRTADKAKSAMKSMLEEVPNAEIEIILLDLNSLVSVRGFAKKFVSKYDRLDLLIENAGIMAVPFAKTAEGFESQLGVNYLAHFLLTNLLFPLLKNTKGSRIITLSSLAHKAGKIDFDNLNSQNSYSKWPAYSQSKLACLMFGYELNRRIKKAGIDSSALSAHPGLSSTNLGQYLPSFVKLLFVPAAAIFGQDSEQGALPTLRAALDSEAKGGEYYGPTGIMEAKGTPGKVESSKISHDLAVAEKLWKVSEKLTGKKFDI